MKQTEKNNYYGERTIKEQISRRQKNTIDINLQHFRCKVDWKARKQKRDPQARIAREETVTTKLIFSHIY